MPQNASVSNVNVSSSFWSFWSFWSSSINFSFFSAFGTVFCPSRRRNEALQYELQAHLDGGSCCWSCCRAHVQQATQTDDCQCESHFEIKRFTKHDVHNTCHTSHRITHHTSGYGSNMNCRASHTGDAVRVGRPLWLARCPKTLVFIYGFLLPSGLAWFWGFV